MNETVYNTLSITGVCASVAQAMGIEPPKQAEAGFDAIDALCGGKIADRVLMYNPDAVAMWLYQHLTPVFAPVMANSRLCLPIKAVMPSVTPVCFGSMYTGAQPAVHGIQSYVKPVIKIDTLFDALIRAGKKPAIVSTKGDSLSVIFLEREMDYFIYDTVQECNEKALELIAADQHDFIVLYNADYDATMHRHAPLGEASLDALKANAAMYARLADAVRTHWKHHDTLLGFAPDHGCHEIDGGLGSHGLEMPEDLNILHFYDFIPRQA